LSCCRTIHLSMVAVGLLLGCCWVAVGLLLGCCVFAVGLVCIVIDILAKVFQFLCL
jgi:hypothetical protein